MIGTGLVPTLTEVAALGCAGEVLGRAAGSGEDFGESLASFRAGGGYRPLPDATRLRTAADAAALRGAGGAGFPTATKLRAVAAATGPKAVVANAEEGEPASVKDRWLVRHRPHLVLDGLRCAAAAVGADQLILYTSDGESADAARAALSELPIAFAPELAALTIHTVEPAYVAGEETAVVRAIDGGEAKPLAKPPRPYQSGVGGRPTLVLNVETLARLGLAVRGVADAGGTVLVTAVVGDRARLYELPAVATVGDTLSPQLAGREPAAVLLGGFAGGIWQPGQVWTEPLSHDALRARGALLGCGAIVAVEPDDCAVAAAADVLNYLAASSSGQCGICTRGTPASAGLLREVCRGTATVDTLVLLARRADALVGRGNCAMPDAAALLIKTLLANFGDTVRSHLGAPCGVCAERAADPSTQTRFRVHPGF